MPESERRRARDRAKVAGGQKHETSEARKTATFPSEVRQAVKKVGNSRSEVEAEQKQS